ncbi:MAG: Coenzyme F420 hydrogenase/dehydrogenase, beta subunit C-terminal domain [Syntrophales bacterium]|nr:Coenzyme F420 hydrogenase/dehydrogenase, beta subunit C-terminal domain [Syntrophales bacterium]MDY0043746.1 Coenzyme F420 hydrogenase/dehydrogenase, beta subunit C-terminal domain [Syntrophales bacterium]
MENIENKLREEAKKLLTEKKVDALVGYEEGTLPFQASPCIITEPEEADKLVWNAFCSVNLAKYVHDIIHRHRESQMRVKPEDRTKKIVGIVARGCTTRSIAIHLQEKQYDRDEVVIIGVPCTGYIAKKKLSKAVKGKEVIECTIEGDSVTAVTSEGSIKIPLKEVLSDSCLSCRYNNPVISDLMIGDAAPPMDPEKEYEDVDAFEALSEEERWAYFTKEMDKCIRCYACRNTCPSCYCKQCFVEQNQPRWVGVGVDQTDTQVFQIMRIFHQVGRCVDCGSCIEVCPMGVDLRKFLKKLDKDGFELFTHRAGESLDSPPPLSAYSLTGDKDDFIFEP